MMEYLFWLCALGSLYSYLVYPVILLALPRRPAHTVAAAQPPLVSVIVTVHNEQRRIEEKLRNTLDVDYPRERLEIIVASDSSTDDTDDIVRRHAAEGVTLVRADERKGKEHAQLLAIRAARGEILLFTDAGTRIERDSIHHLVEDFADSAVGAVSSEDRFINPDGTVAGEGAYVKYEMWLRRLESSRHSVVGLSGSFFAARREVCQAWDVHAPSDFNTAINCAKAGYVAISDPRVVGYYQNIKDESKEYRRKLRTVIRGMTGLLRHAVVLNPFTYGLFAFQVWSHKLMRWAVPWFLVLTFVCSAFLIGRHWIYDVAFGLQVVFYLAGVLALLAAPLRRNAAFRIVYYFLQVNLAIAHAAIAYLLGTRMTVWEPSKR